MIDGRVGNICLFLSTGSCLHNGHKGWCIKAGTSMVHTDVLEMRIVSEQISIGCCSEDWSC